RCLWFSPDGAKGKSFHEDRGHHCGEHTTGHGDEPGHSQNGQAERCVTRDRNELAVCEVDESEGCEDDGEPERHERVRCPKTQPVDELLDEFGHTVASP